MRIVLHRRPNPSRRISEPKYKSVAEALDRVEKDWSGLLDAETEYYEKHLFLSERQRASIAEDASPPEE